MIAERRRADVAAEASVLIACKAFGVYRGTERGLRDVLLYVGRALKTRNEFFFFFRYVTTEFERNYKKKKINK